MGKECFGQIAPYSFGTGDVWRTIYEQAQYKVRQSKTIAKGDNNNKKTVWKRMMMHAVLFQQERSLVHFRFYRG